MAQQINLLTPLFLTPRRYFTAATMLQALGVFVLLGGALSAYWIWSLKLVSAGYEQSVASNQREIDRLKTALRLSQARTAPADTALVQELQARQAELREHEQRLNELRRGLLRDGQGHAARLQLLARSIPAQAWLTEIRADDQRLELAGYTQEPAALNGWMARLAESPLLQGQQLAVVKVEQIPRDVRNLAPASYAVRGPLWTYRLVTTTPAPATTTGGQP